MLQAPKISIGGSGDVPQAANSETSIWVLSNYSRSVKRLRKPCVLRETPILKNGEEGLILYWGISH